MLTAVQQLSALALSGAAGYHIAKQTIANWETRPTRPFVDRLCTKCIGDPVQFHEKGIVGRCEQPPSEVITIANQANGSDDQVILCWDHAFELKNLDYKQFKEGKQWQDLPLPRLSPDQKLYQSFGIKF